MWFSRKKQKENTRWFSRERELKEGTRWFYRWWPTLLGVLSLVLGLSGIWKGPIPYPPIPGLGDFHRKVSPGLFSIGITVLIINEANERRQKEQLRDQLLREIGGPVNAFALRALRELQARQWITDKTLQEADLIEANLEGADLRGLNLRGADLTRAILRRARLDEANLQGANLKGADLKEAVLQWTDLRGIQLDSGIDMERVSANGIMLQGAFMPKTVLRGASLQLAQLQGAYLSGCKLEDTDLTSADLHGTYLGSANLEGATGLTDQQLAQARYLGGAIMPDGKRYDGRYNLKEDLESALEFGNAIPEDPQAMADSYGISLEDYLRGQKWASENLLRVLEEGISHD